MYLHTSAYSHNTSTIVRLFLIASTLMCTTPTPQLDCTAHVPLHLFLIDYKWYKHHDVHQPQVAALMGNDRSKDVRRRFRARQGQMRTNGSGFKCGSCWAWLWRSMRCVCLCVIPVAGSSVFKQTMGSGVALCWAWLWRSTRCVCVCVCVFVFCGWVVSV